MKPAQLAVLGFAVVIAAFIIGLTNPRLVEGSSSDGVTCGMAWGGTASNATESGESDCAQIRSGRFSWSVTLGLLGAGLVVCALIGANKRESGPMPYPAQEFGRQYPPPPPPSSQPGQGGPQQGPPVAQ